MRYGHGKSGNEKALGSSDLSFGPGKRGGGNKEEKKKEEENKTPRKLNMGE